MAEVPVIQVLEKENYFTQALVPLPQALPYPALGESMIRLRTKVFCLTTNNFTYAKLGKLLNWWDAHPIPEYTPAPYNDTDKYGRINCWGYGEVIESTSPAVPKGSFLWGYFPIGTLPQDLHVKPAEVKDQILVTDEFRQPLMAMYNRFLVYPESLGREIAAKKDAVAYDSLIRVMFETAFLMNRYCFTSDPKETAHPYPAFPFPWDAKSADLTDATALILAPGSKVGLSFTHELRNGRTGAKVKNIVGVTTEHSKPFAEATGLYDEVVLGSTDPQELLKKLGIDAAKDKVVLFEFGSRGGVAGKWATALYGAYSNFLFVSVGMEIQEVSSEQVAAGFQQAPPPWRMIIVNASDMRDGAIAKDGAQNYFDKLNTAWEAFRGEGVKGFHVNWGTSMEDAQKGWERLSKGDVKPDEGLAYLV